MREQGQHLEVAARNRQPWDTTKRIAAPSGGMQPKKGPTIHLRTDLGYDAEEFLGKRLR
jgi:hypothetical protein